MNADILCYVMIIILQTGVFTFNCGCRYLLLQFLIEKCYDVKFILFCQQILSLRLPREGDRLKGYGYVDFEDRESLINAMNIADLVSGLFCDTN